MAAPQDHQQDDGQAREHAREQDRRQDRRRDHAETTLYAPVKAFLQDQGYDVKGEVQGCDLVAVRGEDLLIVELKSHLNLTLVLQGVDRLRLTDLVYLAVAAPWRSPVDSRPLPRPSRRPEHWRAVRQLCRRLGLGLMMVYLGASPRGAGPIEVICDPEPYRPRLARTRRARLLGEFRRRTGDRNIGGSTRCPVVTAYREDALRIAAVLHRQGPLRVKELRAATACEKTGSILQKNYYGWFCRVSTGTYRLTSTGEAALQRYADVVRSWLPPPGEPPEEEPDGTGDR